jgi:hypothetical protein
MPRLEFLRKSKKTWTSGLSSASGRGPAGQGWSLGVPFIARQTDKGLPKYDDRANWHPEQDRFVFNGGQELVPICTVGQDLSCRRSGVDQLVTGEQMPAWAAGHQYFRPRVEGSFLRFFWAPSHKTWRVQDKSGVTMELGVPLDGTGDETACVEPRPGARRRAQGAPAPARARKRYGLSGSYSHQRVGDATRATSKWRCGAPVTLPLSPT